MVEGIHAVRGDAENLREARACLYRHAVGCKTRAVSLRVLQSLPLTLAEILTEAAALRDIDELKAAAHTENRQMALSRKLIEREVIAVALRHNLAEAAVRLLTVVNRVNVVTAGD